MGQLRVSNPFPGRQPGELDESISSRYLQVVDRYRTPVCDNCATKRAKRIARGEDPGELCSHTRVFSWTRKPLHELAGEAGGFAEIAPYAYYLAMQETHSTVAAIRARLSIDFERKTYTVRNGTDVRDEPLTLLCAHFLTMRVLGVFREAFALEAVQPELWQRCEEDLREHMESLKPRPDEHSDDGPSAPPSEH